MALTIILLFTAWNFIAHNKIESANLNKLFQIRLNEYVFCVKIRTWNNQQSELDGRFGLKLSIEVLLLLVMQLVVIVAGLLVALCEGFAEDIVCIYSLIETCVPRDWLLNFYVRLSVVVSPNFTIVYSSASFLSKSLFKIFRLRNGKLVNFISSFIEICWLK